jgi:hypothetical protein
MAISKRSAKQAAGTDEPASFRNTNQVTSLASISTSFHISHIADILQRVDQGPYTPSHKSPTSHRIRPNLRRKVDADLAILPEEHHDEYMGILQELLDMKRQMSELWTEERLLMQQLHDFDELHCEKNDPKATSAPDNDAKTAHLGSTMAIEVEEKDDQVAVKVEDMETDALVLVG